ncbi:MAG: hypothetical protein E6717_06560 [Veillonella parvula]|uniref:hypothetical protein n=1 Tax=Veillonella parvula TaxID=29466 RepID=UPI002904D8F2|nr:hypothetical protein [Veillonella parvula]MDU2040909.1 hypothetical protein [Veillonella parvula]
MSDYEIIMLLLQVITVVIAFGALIALIFCFRDAPDGTTRLTIYLYYRDKDIYRQIEINLINTKYIYMKSIHTKL